MALARGGFPSSRVRVFAPAMDPMPLPSRRAALGALLLLVGAWPALGQESDLDAAERFIGDAGRRLAAVTEGNPPAEERQRRVASLLDDLVDVPGVARFCLGRFWRTATPEQQRAYVALFRDVLARDVGLRTSDYAQGGQPQTVRVTTAHPTRNGDLIEVPTTVERPGNAPAQVTWVVQMQGGRPRIADVVAEGVSLRLTQRGDYAAFLARNGNDLELLLRALRQQVAAPAG